MPIRFVESRDRPFARGLCKPLAVILLCAGMALAAPLPAAAFEIFGMKFFEPEPDAEQVVADPLHYEVTLTVETDDNDLKKKIEAASGMVADEKLPVSGSLGLMGKARSERELLVAALYENARYEGIVDVAIDGRPIDSLPPDAEFGKTQPVPVTITVRPGPLFLLGEVRLKGDAAGLEPARFGLVPGGDASSLGILKAEAGIVRALKEEGRPLAKVSGREVVADHASRTLDVTLSLDAGPVAGFGETSVEGTEQVDRDFVAYMAGITRGKTYSPQDLEDARDRLTNLGVFSGVSVREADHLDGSGQVPVDVVVAERKMRYFGAGATYSNTEGVGLEGYWGHRNLFGRAESLRIEGAVSGIGSNDIGKLNYNAALLFAKPGVIGPASKFYANLKTVLEHPDAYDRFAASAEAGVSYDLTRKQSVSAGGEIEYSKITDTFGTKRHLIVGIPLQYVYDNRNDKLNPTKGFRLLAFGEPAYDILTGTTFVKVRGEASAYQSFDKDNKFVLAGRVALGSILGASVEDIPADRRFYAGGGGSVRGYAYQGIGPKAPDGTPTGGLSYAEGSVEMRIGITEKIGLVPFVDAGTVSQKEFPTFSDVKVGAGLGLRYLTPFGPLRIDFAVPLNRDPDDPRFGLYAGIGQSF